MIPRRDCKHFKGDVPCEPNKKDGVQCDNCLSYVPILTKILIIKLGAMGDVIRTTPILTRLKKIHPHSEIYWVTYTPDILPKEVDYKFEYNFKNIQILECIEFDLLINLDKDWESCALTNRIGFINKKGYHLLDGKPAPINSLAYQKYLNGIFDEESKKNKKHYVQEIFEICDIGKFEGEEYLLSNGEKGKHSWNLDSRKKVIGLNTGCGEKWLSRLWPTANWIELAGELRKLDYEVVILGGEQEAYKNNEIALGSGANYFGVHSLNVFIDLIDNCDLIVSQITMALHIAVGLKKKVVVMNNIFNSNEFHLYGLGKLVEPKTGCDCYYLSECKRERHCMEDITVEIILETIQGVI